MTETELKIHLDAAGEERLRRHPALATLRQGAARTQSLVSVYCDTPDHALAKAGIALRLRKTGRSWVQTVKKGPREGSRGLFATTEIDRPAPGGRLSLGHDDAGGVYDEIRALADGAEVAPVYETRVKRTATRLRTEAGVVELALDRGEVIAGALSAPIREAELELVEGEVHAIFEVARALFTEGPVRFSAEPKSARGLRLATRGIADEPLAPRTAGALAYGPDATVEEVARDVFRDCLAQIADNMVVVAESDDVEGPHQLRIGLRRLRTAFAVFGPSLGDAAFAALADAARRIGQAVGALRDLDVLVDELVAPAVALGLDGEAAAALSAAIGARRDAVRAEVRAALAASESVRFLFDCAEMIEGRAWLAPADYSQTGRLATRVEEMAPGVLGKRWGKVMKMGRDIEALDAEALHALRKELKKLRYAVDTLAPIFAGKRHAAYRKALKKLQDTFGSLNDAAMAAALLAGPEAPGAEVAAAQRAAGWVLGSLAVKVRDDRPRLFATWRKFAKAKPFWE